MAATPFTPPKLEESKAYHSKHIALNSDDPEPYYWIGFIDWTLSYRANTEARAEYNKSNPRKQVKDDEPLPPKVREEYTAKYSRIVEEGIRALNKAIELRSDYDDAMGMLNLLLRRKADQVASAEERERLLRQADALVDKVKEIKQKKMESSK